MDHSAIAFSLKKGDDGFLTGFSLTAVKTYADCFCFTFPFAQTKKKARIEFGEGKVRFVHDGIGPDETPIRLGIYGGCEGGTYETDITPEDAAALQDFLHQRGRYDGTNIKFRLEIAWGKGFSLRAELPVAITRKVSDYHDTSPHS